MRFFLAALLAVAFHVSAAFCQTSAVIQTAEPWEVLVNCSYSEVGAMPLSCENLIFEVRGENLSVDTHGFKANGRYAPLIQKMVASAPNQSAIPEYEIYAYSFHIFNALNNCSVADARFEDCFETLDATYETCKAIGAYTTWAYNVCGSAKLRVLELVLKGEIAIFQLVSSEEQFDLLTRSQAIWDEFLEVECNRKFEKYRGGSIAPVEEVFCKVALHENRIPVINNENRFQGRDLPEFNEISVHSILLGLAL